MGRGRGKGKKLTAIACHQGPGSGGDEHHLPECEIAVEHEMPMIEDDDEEEEEEENAKNDKEWDNVEEETSMECVKKRKRLLQINENSCTVLAESGSIDSPKAGASMRTIGYRQSGSRRKSKPHRAAEAVVPVLAAVYKGA